MLKQIADNILQITEILSQSSNTPDISILIACRPEISHQQDDLVAMILSLQSILTLLVIEFLVTTTSTGLSRVQKSV